MNEKKIPYSIQAAFAAAVGKDKEAHDIIGHALAEMTNGACQFAQSYSYWGNAIFHPVDVPFWMPLPKPPEEK